MNLGIGLQLSGRGPLVQVFDPASISGMLVRYKAADAVLNAGRVDTLPNTGTMGAGAANANNLAFGTARPLYVASSATFGGRPSVSHDGNSALLTNGTYTTSVTQPMTWYVYASLADLGDANPLRIRGGRTGSRANAAALDIVSSTDGLTMSTNALAITATTTALYGKHVICCVYNGASSAIYIDDMTTPAFTGNADTNACTSFYTGYGFGATNPSYEWPEHFGYTAAHNATQRTNVQSYYTATYG